MNEPRGIRLGELLLHCEALDAAQVELILERQQETGEPFGLLSERMFGVDPDIVETAWAEQYASLTRMIDPSRESFDPHALSLVMRRQAWQFRVLPVRFDGSELMLATMQSHLSRALRFAMNVLSVPTFIVLAEPNALGAALCRHYPMPGMTPGSLLDGQLDRLLARLSGGGAGGDASALRSA